MKQPIKYRLGLDLGSNSLGWCVLTLDAEDKPSRFVRMGVRIFSDGRNPKDGTSLAAGRRLARAMRRRRDRFLKRRARLMLKMIEHGFMPANRVERESLRTVDPYELRLRGLDQALTQFEFGRALFHLNQRRGFQSNRKVDRMEKEDGKIAGAISKVREQMSTDGARTVGEWLARRHASRSPVRARLNGQGAKSSYELYVQRAMIADEFDQLWKTQAEMNPAVYTPIARDVLRDALLYQRKLRPVIPGKCPFELDERRAPLALPSVQRFRIFQEVNNLRVRSTGEVDCALTIEQRDRVADYLLRFHDRSFEQLRKLLGLGEDATFNLESDKRKKLLGDSTGSALAKKDIFGQRWHSLPPIQQDEVAKLLLDTEMEETVIVALTQRFGLSVEQAKLAAQVRMVEGYGSISSKAIMKMQPFLEAAIVTYDQAAASAGYDHSMRFTGGDMPNLPYYAEFLQKYVGTGTGERKDKLEKRYGRIANPTVHVGLNQLRIVINRLIAKYGRPEQIVIELARELKLSRERKRELEQQQSDRQDDNERFLRMLQENGLPPKPGNFLRLRLWEELAASPTDRRCPYTGEMISIKRLFSDEVEIEHILPFCKTLDDSIANKTVAMRKANRDKADRAPFDAFGHSPGGYVWEQIINRASLMPYPRRRRFSPDALEQFAQDGDFLARHLNDTAYLSRVAREYLTAICPIDRVWSIPGRLTAMLRRRWGLNSLLSDGDIKNRTDQRHHTIDACVVAVTDRRLLQTMSVLSAYGNEARTARFLEGLEAPWEGFREGLSFGLSKVMVSYKPDHGTGTQLHNDSAYGVVGQPVDFNSKVSVVRRRSISSLTSDDKIAQIRDPLLREKVARVVAGKSGKDAVAALDAFALETGVRRLRAVEMLSVIPIRRVNGEVYKAYKGDSNYCFRVLAAPKNGGWIGEVVSSFGASAGVPGHHPDLVMQLCTDDTIQISKDGSVETLRLVKFSKGRATFAELQEGGALKERDADPSDPFKYKTYSASRLEELKARHVVVDPIGQVWPAESRLAGANS
jgi:CRISPR-associated endonuclease Csn1